MADGYGFHEGEVTAIREVSPSMRRVTIAGRGLAGFDVSAPGQWIKLFVDDSPRGGRAMTVRDWRIDRLELDIDIASHPTSDGLVGRWLQSAASGSRVRLAGPRSTFRHLPGHKLHLFGDETALPAISAIVEHLPSGAEAFACIEIRRPDAVLEAASMADVTWRWLVCGTETPGAGLLRCCRELGCASGSDQAFVGCEATAAREIRQLLQAAGFAPGTAHVSGYWKAGAREHVDAESDY